MQLAGADGSERGFAQPGRSSDRTSLLRLWFELSLSSRRLVAAGAATLAALVLAVVLTAWQMHRDALADGQRHLDRLGRALAEQTHRAIEAVDYGVVELRARVRDLGLETEEQFIRAMQSWAMHDELLQRDAGLPQAEIFFIVGANGTVIDASRRLPTPPLDVSGRGWFRHLRDSGDMEALIGKPSIDRGTGTRPPFVARRINGTSGAFLGVAVCGLDGAFFRSFYQVLTEGDDIDAAMWWRDGSLAEGFSETVAVPPPPGLLVLGKRIEPGEHSTVPRLVSVQPVAGYPLTVHVSAAESIFLPQWRRAVVIAAAGTGTAVICVLLLLRALIAQLRRLEEQQASLVEQNHRLEAVSGALRLQSDELSANRAQLAEKSETLETALAHMNQGIAMIDANRRIVVTNARALEMLDLPRTFMETNPSFDDVVRYQHTMAEFGEEDKAAGVGTGTVVTRPFVYERRRPNGVVLEIQSIPLASGGMVRTFTDITERKLAEERIRFFAHHDDLTKLHNRAMFHERLAEAIEVAKRIGSSVAVLYIDLDRFKLVNDTRGHGAGDRLLMQVASRLRGAVRTIDTVARTGGDEFAIIQPLVEQPGASTALASRLLDQLQRPFDVDESTCCISGSVGIALFPDHAENAADLVRSADTALYCAKSGGRGMTCLFEPSMDDQQARKFQLEQELRIALELRQFDLDYQPIVDSQSGRITSCEALLRWHHPQRGVVGPGEFIAIAEHSGLIVPIGLWVLETACAEAACWPEPIKISVNLSPAQFNHASLADRLTEILVQSGLAPQRLVLEVTEGLLLESSSVVLGIMSQLRELGVRFTLDDFGTAHAGLSYLRQFPFDAIKIDRSFIKDMLAEPGVRAIVSSLLDIGAALHLDVVAEGVETVEQLDALRQMKCHLVQGFLTGRPASAAQTRVRLQPAGGGASSPRAV